MFDVRSTGTDDTMQLELNIELPNQVDQVLRCEISDHANVGPEKERFCSKRHGWYISFTSTNNNSTSQQAHLHNPFYSSLIHHGARRQGQHGAAARPNAHTVLPMLNHPPADPLVPIKYRNPIKCQLDALAHAGREIPRLEKRTKQARRVGMRPALNDTMNIEIFC